MQRPARLPGLCTTYFAKLMVDLFLAPPQGVDCAFLQYLGARILERAASVHLLFAFEYVIQVHAHSEKPIVGPLL